MAARAQPPLDLVSQGPCGDASIHTHLADGRRICFRTVSPADEARLREGIARMSPRSRYLRFFTGGASPPDWIIERLLGADGVRHLAWGALDLTDVILPLNWYFSGGAEPVAPGPYKCGPDPASSADALPECNYDPDSC